MDWLGWLLWFNINDYIPKFWLYNSWFSTIKNIINIIFTILLIYFMMSMVSWLNISKDFKYEKYIPWENEYWEKVVKYWWNENLKKIAKEIEWLYKNWVLSDFMKWVLLYGPPWTWKTLFGKYLAKRLKLPFYYISANNFKNEWYWWTSKNIRKLFESIQKDLKRTWYRNWIIFIDELDWIWTDRNSTHEASADWLNTLLTQIDWIKKDNNIIIWSTNRKEVLDSALISRFDLKIYVTPPTKEERKEIINNHFINAFQNVLKR